MPLSGIQIRSVIEDHHGVYSRSGGTPLERLEGTFGLPRSVAQTVLDHYQWRQRPWAGWRASLPTAAPVRQNYSDHAQQRETAKHEAAHATLVLEFGGKVSRVSATG